MNEFERREELREKRNKIETFDDLVNFLKYVEDTCNGGYGEAPIAIAQACLAVGYRLSDVFGITGFQAGCTMWDFVRDWSFQNNKTGLKIVDYDDMLYPQYGDVFEKTITEDTWESIQKEANSLIEERKHAHPAVIQHWKDIVAGKVPFGYSVRDR